MHKIAIFLGPTLSLAEAQQILPHAWYLSPVECGDILQIMRLKPNCIVIIDGLYEQKAAVWHKEILLALEHGVCVVGASSMGALRAAELAHFGMIGIGQIFADFYHQRLNDDDEVAVLHGLRHMGYSAINEPLVNIRATIKKAMTENIITPAQGERVIAAAKKHHYPQRSLTQACETLMPNEDFSQLLAWAQAGNQVDQKRLDAIAALQWVKKGFTHPKVIAATAPTNFIHSLLAFSNTRAFSVCYDFLPPDEKELCFLRDTKPQEYKELQALAQLLMIIHGLASPMHTSPMTTHKHHKITEFISHYLEDPHLLSIYQWILTITQGIPNFEAQLNTFLRWTQLLFTHPPTTFQYALLWLCLDTLTQTHQLRINSDDVQSSIANLMQQHQIDSLEKLEAFMGELTMEEFNLMMMSYAYLQIVFKEKNYSFLKPNKKLEIINWLQKALLAGKQQTQKSSHVLAQKQDDLIYETKL
jgi:hypothetical protein